MHHLRIILAILLSLISPIHLTVKFNKNLKSFSHSVKKAVLYGHNIENVMFRYEKGPGVITEQFISGNNGCADPTLHINIYIDGEKTPSLDYNMFFAHAVNMTNDVEDKFSPWATSRFGHTAHRGGGYFNTYRIPFGKNIKITFQRPGPECAIWYIVRGVENLPIVVGDFELPPSARLKVYKTEDFLAPEEYVNILKIQKKSGIVFQMTISANSKDLQFLESCYRLLIDSDNWENMQLLSSGTEDLYLSALYFNAGVNHFENAGVTFINRLHGSVVAYKFFERDPVIFHENITLVWRCGENVDYGCYYKPPQKDCWLDGNRKYCFPKQAPQEQIEKEKKGFDLSETFFKTYVWVYECIAIAKVQVNEKMKTFGTSTKEAYIRGNWVENVMFEYNKGPGVITEQSYIAGLHCTDENMFVNVYIDGETEPSLDFNMFFAHGINTTAAVEDKFAPWATSLFGHAAHNGGAFFNTYRIPFGRSIKITVRIPGPASCIMWYIVKGVENYPVVIGDLILPANTRLKLYKTDGLLNPHDYVTIAKVNNKSGIVFQVAFAGRSKDLEYLEACYRVLLDSDDWSNVQLLSSGTEDFYLSSYYFNAGVNHFENAGVTYIDHSGIAVAYKFFEKDPIIFQNNMTFLWRCGEDRANGCYYKPPKSDCWYVGGRRFCYPEMAPSSDRDVKLSVTLFKTYVWVYEW
ncbi:DgyrCDS7961 [Dimorphilus gyrociliatus]|uniref:DgyrCDS7961 n=1 Tax=Dimorphilus gyrociliatus TaxID=2664684 RepID=A0A7I8VSV5_9ANNE|nr:DgyrCDS7961 [Dimorphilus gyrociliatus]